MADTHSVTPMDNLPTLVPDRAILQALRREAGVCIDCGTPLRGKKGDYCERHEPELAEAAQQISDTEWIVWVAPKGENPTTSASGLVVGKGETCGDAYADAWVTIENLIDRLKARYLAERRQ